MTDAIAAVGVTYLVVFACATVGFALVAWSLWRDGLR